MVRRFFTHPPLETFIARMTAGRERNSFWVRLMPPNYLYPKGSRRTATRNGVNYALDISDYMEHSIYFAYKDEALESLLEIASGCKVIIDVGANIGATALNLAKQHSTKMVIGFEPDGGNFAKAQANIRLNNLNNIRLLKRGLGSRSALVRLYKVNPENQGMNRILTDDAADFDFEEIQVQTLDDFVREEQLDVDLIKIDVEGYELNVLRGAVETINRCRPKLFIELDDENLKAHGDSAAELVRFLTGLHYKVKPINSDRIVTEHNDLASCHMDIVCTPNGN
jgi:FkbM family methyltransferase